MLKAGREAKLHLSWINVNAQYEIAVREFVQASLGRLDENLFLDEFLLLQRRIAWLGMLNGLSQTAIKLASPGVQEIFQAMSCGICRWWIPTTAARAATIAGALCWPKSRPYATKIART